MRHFKYTAIILITLFFTISCQEDSPTEPIGVETLNASGQPIPEFTDVANLNGILATIYYEFDSGVSGIPPVGLTMGYAQLGKMVDGGDVSVNNNQLDLNTQNGKVFYIKPGPGTLTQLNNVIFNGSLHQWSVSGNGDIPLFEGEIISPTKFDVTAPQNKSTITKTNDLDISWTRTGSDDEKILITLISLSNSKSIVAEQNLPNSGSYKIESSKLSSLTGEVMVQVVKYRYKGISANNKDYLIVSEVVKTLTLTVQ